jgi:DNA polymerase I-like protein with 3'-5' exonuclease and polymerase domains
MLISADIKSLEVVTCAYLSQDEILCREVLDGIDFHELNRRRFGLPDRVTAKRFKFKLIYGATAFGYANDSDFIDVSTSQKFWQEVIDEYYNKYRGVRKWHTHLVEKAASSGVYVSPSGRIYKYPIREIIERIWYWRPKILNYPVQGFGADLVMIARVTFWNRLKKQGINCLPVSSVHDSIVVDTSKDLCYNVCKLLRNSVVDVPANFEKLYGERFNLPLNAEIKQGNDMKNMEVVEC